MLGNVLWEETGFERRIAGDAGSNCMLVREKKLAIYRRPEAEEARQRASSAGAREAMKRTP
jgi:hypothetical protein